MSCYLSFSDKEVYEGVTPPEGMATSLTEEAEPHSATAIPAIASKEQVARKTSQEPARWKKCFTHPGLWWLLGSSLAQQEAQEQTYLLMANHNWHMRIAPTEAPSPM